MISTECTNLCKKILLEYNVHKRYFESFNFLNCHCFIFGKPKSRPGCRSKRLKSLYKNEYFIQLISPRRHNVQGIFIIKIKNNKITSILPYKLYYNYNRRFRKGYNRSFNIFVNYLFNYGNVNDQFIELCLMEGL